MATIKEIKKVYTLIHNKFGWTVYRSSETEISILLSTKRILTSIKKYPKV